MKLPCFIGMAAVCTFFLCHSSAAASNQLPVNGRLIFHRYTSYSALDSMLYLSDRGTESFTAITSDQFIHAMNGDFGSHSYDIVFMAIDPKADEWDLFRYNAVSGAITNLTPNSGYRNEDPKFSPDGYKIVFKRGYWSQDLNDFIYNLAELDLRTNMITMLTDDSYEQSMPYYTSDGAAVCYAMTKDSTSGIYQLDLSTGISECLFTETGDTAYYPVITEERLYFTKWHSITNQNDCIVELTEKGISLLPFNDEAYNCSDPFPMRDGSLFFSSTRNGTYDLYYYCDGSETPVSAANSESNELGSAYFSEEDAMYSVQAASDYVLGRESRAVNVDANGDGTVNAFDLALLKKQLSS